MGPRFIGRGWHEASFHDIQTTLDGMGESYKLYLRDTSILQNKHVNALKIESDEVIKLLGSNKDILPNSIVQINDDMGEYLPLN